VRHSNNGEASQRVGCCRPHFVKISLPLRVRRRR
jgi:hypothetical protein